MNYSTKTVFLLVMAYAFAMYVTAQSTIPPPQAIPPARAGKVATYHDAARNLSNVVLSFTDVSGESACGLYIGATSSFSGKTVDAPSDVTLIIMRITPEEKIKVAPLRDLTFIADGENVNLGLLETARQESSLGLRWETLQTSVPHKLFMKIATARKVEAKLGLAKFMLTENNLYFMRDFINRITPKRS